MTIMVATSGAGFRRGLVLLLLAVSFGGAGSATAQPARSPADQARAFLEDHFAAAQEPPRRRARPLEGWMTSRFAGLWTRAKARGQREETPFPEADPILNAQDSERPGDIRIEEVAGTADRPAVRVSFRVFAGDATRTTQILVFAEDRNEWRLFDVLTPQDGQAPASLRQQVERFVATGR
jgi:hypothetical protein